MAVYASRYNELNAALVSLINSLGRNGEKELTPDQIVASVIKHAREVDEHWDEAPDHVRANTVSIALAGLFLAYAFRSAGFLMHVAGPFVNYRLYRTGLLFSRKAGPILTQFVEKRATEADANRVAARMHINSTFFDEAKRVWEAHKKGATFTHRTTAELRERARQARN